MLYPSAFSSFYAEALLRWNILINYGEGIFQQY